MYRIFVIEDDDAINRLLCMNLSIAGYEPIPAKDGLEALKMIQNGERFDVAIVDVMLPGIDGFYLMEPLKAHGIPVIYLTAKNDLESKLTGLTTGAEDYLFFLMHKELTDRLHFTEDLLTSLTVR